jgi:hypothetical protein
MQACLLRYVPNFDRFVSRSAGEHVLLELVPTQTQNCLSVAAFFEYFLCLFGLLFSFGFSLCCGARFGDFFTAEDCYGKHAAHVNEVSQLGDSVMMTSG